MKPLLISCSIFKLIDPFMGGFEVNKLLAINYERKLKRTSTKSSIFKRKLFYLFMLHVYIHPLWSVHPINNNVFAVMYAASASFHGICKPNETALDAGQNDSNQYLVCEFNIIFVGFSFFYFMFVGLTSDASKLLHFHEVY